MTFSWDPFLILDQSKYIIRSSSNQYTQNHAMSHNRLSPRDAQRVVLLKESGSRLAIVAFLASAVPVYQVVSQAREQSSRFYGKETDDLRPRDLLRGMDRALRGKGYFSGQVSP
jgi:hypothetical protein